MSGFTELSGMAGTIRRAIESEQLDLAGYTEQRVTDVVTAAFSSPLDAPTEMLRFTFIVGGGKLVRSRYSDDISKWMLCALRDVGYTEDRSAAETFDSQGTYKQQHDTGANLKYVIVYPRVTCATMASSSTEPTEPILDTNSHEHMLITAEMTTFQQLVKSKIWSWKQKKTALKVLQEGVDNFDRIEQALISGNVLNERDQAIYDANSGADAEKIAWLQKEIKALVDTAKLTLDERNELAASVKENIKTITEEADNSTGPKAAKLQEKLGNTKARLQVIEKLEPVTSRLRFCDEILALRLRTFPLAALADKGRSCSLTIQDLKKIEEKNELDAEIGRLENASRGWFQSEAAHAAVCAYEVNFATKLYAKHMASKSKGKR